MTTPVAPVRAFLFDIGNVLLRFDFSLALRAVAAHSKIHDPVEILGAIDRVKVAYEDGQIERPVFLRSVFDLLSYTGSEADFIAAWEDIFEPNAPMVALVKKLSGHFPLYLLSNTSDIHRDYIFRRYPFFQEFSAGVYSFAVKCSKPGPEIYRIACRELALTPETTFFIDDLLPNIETARNLGFLAHHYHHDRHDQLLAEPALRAILDRI